MIPLLAWRNLWRHPRRTLLTILAIAFASAVLVFFVGLQYSSYDTSINASIRLLSGHLQVQQRGYNDRPELRLSIPGSVILEDKIRSLPDVTAVTRRSIGFAILSSEDRSYGAQIVGVEAANEGKLSTIPGVIRSGRYLTDDSALEIVIGKALAQNLKVAIGDDLTLLGQGRDGSLAATVLPVVGIFETGGQDLDRHVAHIPIETFDETFGMEGQVHALVVSLTGLESIPLTKSHIDKLLTEPTLVTLTWEELLPGIKQSIELDMAGGWLFYISLILIVLCTILNTFLMSILERTKEFAVMLALGSTPSRIIRLVLLECFLLTMNGIIIGIIVGSAFLVYFGVHGFTVPGSEEFTKVWNLPNAVYTKLTLRAVGTAPLIILISTLIAVLYPTLRIRQLEPTESMRGR